MTMRKKVKGLLIGGAVVVVAAGGGIYAYQNVGYTLSKSEAQAIAYKQAGVSQADVSFSTIEKEREGLKATYDIEFSTTSGEYSYTIDASSGSILDREFDSNGFSDSSSTSSTSPSSSDASTTDSTGISQDDAKARALGDAGLDESTVTNLTVQADTDGGLSVYEVDFQDSVAGIEYDYTIDAGTGEVIEKSTDSIND